MIKNNQTTKKTHGLEARRQVFLAVAIISIVLFSVNFASSTTTVTLNSPANGFNNTFPQVTFNCSASDDSTFLTNISLWTNLTGSFKNNINLTIYNYTNSTNLSDTYNKGTLTKSFNFNDYTIFNKIYVMGQRPTGAINSNLYIEVYYRNGTTSNTTIEMVYPYTLHIITNNLPTTDVRNITVKATYGDGTGTMILGDLSIETVTIKTNSSISNNELIASSNYLNLFNGNNNIKEIVFPNVYIREKTIWNCEYCSNNSDCSFAASNYSINYDTTLNSVSYNLTTYETSSENYVLNITSAYTPTNAKLIYNGTEYPATITTSGTTHLISKNLQIPSSSIGSNYFYFKWNVSSTVTEYSINYTQTVSPMLFGICNATLTVPYWNISFKDESTLSSINGTLQGSTFVYYLGNGTINKTLSYSVTTNSSSYRFCSLPADKPYYVLPDVHYSLTGYPTRIYNPSLLTLTNSTTNTTLYLLSSADGIYVTFITASTSNTPISGVDIEITRVLGGSTATIFSGLTDSAGSVTVWLNPNYDHTITASKTGYTTNTQTIKPTQSQYTLTMETGLDDYEYVPDRKGLKWFAFPSSGVIKTTNYTLFGYNVSAKNDNLVSCKLELLNSNKTIIITSAEVFATNSTLCSVSINYSMNYSKVKGRLLVDLGDGYKILEDDAYWSLVEYNTTGSTLLDWFRGLDELEVSYFNDDEQHREYTYILLFFLVVMIICASLNRMGWDIQTNGGMIFLVGILIWIASIPGFLTLSDISPFAIIDKFFVAILYSMFMVGFAMRELT